LGFVYSLKHQGNRQGHNEKRKGTEKDKVVSSLFLVFALEGLNYKNIIIKLV